MTGLPLITMASGTLEKYLRSTFRIEMHTSPLCNMQASEKCEDTFKLPSKPDEVWINFTSILAIIAAPTPYGKTKRQYKVNTETVEMISRLHTSWLEKNTSNE